MLGHLDHDVISSAAAVIIKAGQALQASGTRSEDFDVAIKTIGTQFVCAFRHLVFFAESDLGRNIWTRNRQRTGFSAATIVLLDLLCIDRGDQTIHRFKRVLQFHRCVTRIVIHIPCTRYAFQFNVLFQ